MKQTKTMFGVEHAYIDGRKTYDIFSSLIEAKRFCQKADYWNEKHAPLFIFQADFNKELVYFDKMAKGWNYDDFSDIIVGNYKIIQRINEYPTHFAI